MPTASRSERGHPGSITSCRSRQLVTLRYSEASALAARRSTDASEYLSMTNTASAPEFGVSTDALRAVARDQPRAHGVAVHPVEVPRGQHDEPDRQEDAP